MAEHNVIFGGLNCKVIKRQYGNNRIALLLFNHLEGPIAKATVNIVDVVDDDCPEGYTFIKDYGENQGILKVLVDGHIVEDTGKIVKWGIETAHLVKVLI